MIPFLRFFNGLSSSFCAVSWATAAVLTCLAPRANADEPWRLVYADDFDRQEVGDAWSVVGREGYLRIIDGEFTIDGVDGAAVFRQPVPGDQKVVLRARWIDGTSKALVQFAPGLKCSYATSRIPGVRISFGRHRNTSNTIEFMGWSHRLARNAGPLPESGRVYELTYVVEGKRAWLDVDGQRLIEAELPFELHGRTFDHIVLAGTGAKLRYDRVEIYHKNVPPPMPRLTYPYRGSVDAMGRWRYDGDPAVAGVVALASQEKWAEAIDAAQAVADPALKLEAFMMLARHVELPDYDRLCELIAAHVRESDPRLADVAERMRIVVKTGARDHRVANYAGWIEEQLDRNHPFYLRLMLDYGRAVYWNARESRLKHIFDEAARIMGVVKERDATLTLPRMYLGEQFVWDEHLLTDTPDAPRWARLAREYHQRCLRIIEWWGAHRQTKSGDLGGGWGDDVEILRSWSPILLATDASEAGRQAMRRLVDGAWTSAYGGLELGYMKRVEDVEHASEPTADTQPIMLAFEPDNPEYVRRNALLVPLVRDLWTAKSPMGLRRFKSIYYSATEVDPSEDLHADVPYQTRAFKGLTWLAWHGGDPEATALWLELADAWVEATMRQADGKLAGVVPAAVAQESDRLGGAKGTWHSPNLLWTYFDFTKENQFRILDLLVSAYELTGESKYIEPVLAAFELARSFGGAIELEPEPRFGERWQRWALATWEREGLFVERLLRYRRASGDAQFDSYLADFAARKGASASARFTITGDGDALADALIVGLETEGLRYNLPMWTSQPQSTDRVYFFQAADLFRAFTGATMHWGDSATPDHLLTWSHPNADFAAIVRQPGPRDPIRIRFYSFDQENSRFGIRFWRLAPGTYRYTWQAEGGDAVAGTFTLAERGGQLDLDLPAGKAIDIEIASP